MPPVEHRPTLASASKRDRRRRATLDVATLSTLSITQAVAVAALAESISARACIRDILLEKARAQFGTRGSARADAYKLAERLADPGEGAHAEVLRTINSLARTFEPLSAARIERVLRRLEGAA